jgi:phosphoserine phosphatase
MELSDLLTAVDEDLRRRVAGLTRLLNVTRVLAREMESSRILKVIVREACTALACDRASVFAFDPQAGELYTVATNKLETDEIRVRLGEGIAGHVARTRTVANVSQPADDPRWTSRIDRELGYHTRNVLAGPLIGPRHGELLGVLELINKAEGNFDAFDERLLEAFSQHAAIALDRAAILEELREREAVEASLKIARDVQRGFMPRELPQIAGYELASWWFPNQAVGGDYCDVVPLIDGRTALVVADVSGHGLGPALLMASVRASLRTLALEHSAPEVLLRLLVRALASDLRQGKFITAVVAVLDARCHRLVYANAGHAPAEVYHRAQDAFVPLGATGVPLGVEEHADYPQGPAHALAPGDLVLLCTDGIVEAVNQQGEPFGLHRVHEVVRRLSGGSVEQIVREIGSQVTAHYGGENPPDDLTVLAARRVV